MKAEASAEVAAILKEYPVSMPAWAACRILGVTRNTFHKRVRQGCIRYVQENAQARKRYLTDYLCLLRGIER